MASGRANRVSLKRLFGFGELKSRAASRVGLFLWLFLGAVLLALTLLLGMLWGSGEALQNAGSGMTRSTTERTALDRGSAGTCTYYYDGFGWITEGRVLVKGMKYFTRRTGVQPVLVLTEDLEGVDPDDEAAAGAYMQELYSSLCPDEAHVLLVFYISRELRDRDYDLLLYAGEEAAAVLDEEALAILRDYIDRAYYSYDSYLNDGRAKMFAAAFRSCARTIMHRSAIRPVLAAVFCAAAGVILLDFGLYLRRAVRGYREEKKKHPEGMMK